MMKKLILLILFLNVVCFSQTEKTFWRDIIYHKLIGYTTSGDSLVMINGDTLATRPYTRSLVGSRSFTNMTSGTNTTATMTLGAGGTLTYTSTGVVNANQLVGVTGIDATEAGYLNNTKLANLMNTSLAFSAVGSSDVIYESATNGTAGVAINYHGYNNGTTQFRDFVIYDGKENQVAYFRGSDKLVTLTGYVNTLSGYQLNGGALTITNLDAHLTDFPDQTSNSGKYLTTNGTALSWGTVSAANDTANMQTKATIQVVSGSKYYTSTQYYSAVVAIQGAGQLNIRSGGTSSVTVNYESGNDFIVYNGGTTVAFSVQETGAGYFAGTVNAVSGYQVNGSALSYSHVGAAASSHTHSISDITTLETRLAAIETWLDNLDNFTGCSCSP